jgi:ABC-type uncharacterized transport system ATPase subunit
MNVMDTRATSAMLYLDGVHVSFDGFHAINNLSLALEPIVWRLARTAPPAPLARVSRS